MTKLDIWNAALALLPHDRPVLDAAEDTVEANRCRDNWDAARRAVLTAREWGWLVTESPGCCTGTWGEGWLYERPADAVRIIGLCTTDGRRIRADAVNCGLRALEPFAAVRYIPDEPDPERWPSPVRDAVVHELAARICPLFTDNPARSAELRQAAVAALEEAGKQDAMETAYDGSDPLVFVHARR